MEAFPEPSVSLYGFFLYSIVFLYFFFPLFSLASVLPELVTLAHFNSPLTKTLLRPVPFLSPQILIMFHFVLENFWVLDPI